MSLTRLFFVLIFVLSVFLRFYDLTGRPVGFYTDEAAFGYNAYSLLKTGKDEFGKVLPLIFHSFGDYKSPLFFYYLVPYVAVFDLTVGAVRSGAAVLGIGTVIGVFFLAKLLTHNNRVSLASMFFISVMPFSLQFSRMVHENNLSVFLLTYGIIFFLLSKNRRSMYALSGIFFGLSIYAYHDAKILMPFLVAGLLFIFRKTQNLKIKDVVFFLLPSLLLAAAFLLNLTASSGLHRPLSVLVFSDQGTIADIIGWRQDVSYYRNENITLLNKLLINKPSNYFFVFAEHYLAHYAPSFLFFFGDPVKIYSTVGVGIMPVSYFPLLALGFVLLFTRFNRSRNFFIWILLIAPLSGALTQYVPSASRTFFLILPFSILTGMGGAVFSEYLRKKNYFFPVTFLFVCFFVFELVRFLNLYFFVTPVRYSKEWNYKRQELLADVAEYSGNYTNLWFTKQVGEYIYPLFFNKIDPVEFQNTYTFQEVDKYGFQWVSHFGKYTFDSMPLDPWVDRQTLYVGVPENFDSGVKPIKIIRYPSGNPAYYILDYRSFTPPREY